MRQVFFVFMSIIALTATSAALAQVNPWVSVVREKGSDIFIKPSGREEDRKVLAPYGAKLEFLGHQGAYSRVRYCLAGKSGCDIGFVRKDFTSAIKAPDYDENITFKDGSTSLPQSADTRATSQPTRPSGCVAQLETKRSGLNLRSPRTVNGRILEGQVICTLNADVPLCVKSENYLEGASRRVDVSIAESDLEKLSPACQKSLQNRSPVNGEYLATVVTLPRFVRESLNQVKVAVFENQKTEASACTDCAAADKGKNEGFLGKTASFFQNLTASISDGVVASASTVKDVAVEGASAVVEKVTAPPTYIDNEPVAVATGATLPIAPSEGEISSEYSKARKHPTLGIVRPHRGLDIARKPGIKDMSVRAAKSGRVKEVGCSGDGYGCKVVIDHGQGVTTLYAHLNRKRMEKFKVGQPIDRGQYLGIAGETGVATGIHLHFEVMVDDEHVDPKDFLGELYAQYDYDEGYARSKARRLAKARGGSKK